MKTVKITFAMRNAGDFNWHKVSREIEVLDRVAEDLELHQNKSRYVMGPYKNGRGKALINDLIQISAKLAGFDEACFHTAEIIG